MTPFDSFSFAAALVALLIAAGFLIAAIVAPRLRSFRWWAASFALLGFWLATSTLRPEIGVAFLRALGWASLFAAVAVIGLVLRRPAGGIRQLPILLCGALTVLTLAALMALRAPPPLWMVIAPVPTTLLLLWFSAGLARRRRWVEAGMVLAGAAVVMVRCLLHPSGLAALGRMPPPPPPGLRGGLSLSGMPLEPPAAMPPPPPPGALPPVEEQLALTLLVVAALLVLAGFLALRDLLGELERMRQRSATDAMTGLFNRLTFEETATTMLDEPGLQPVWMVLFDIDHFKRINDTAGHATGDHVIGRLGHLLREMSVLRTCAGRIGGEEFAVLLAGCDLSTARAYAETVRTGFSASRFARPIDWPVTLSAGLALHVPGQGLGALLDTADKALYAAKQAGRDRVVIAGQAVVQPLGRVA